MVRKLSREGVGYSTADLNHVRYVFASAVPRRSAGVLVETGETLATIADVIHDQGARNGIVRQTIFVKDPQQIDSCREIIHGFYGDDLPATDFVVQPPCAGHWLTIEAWGVGRRNGADLQIDRVSENLVIVHHSGVSWAHCAGILPETPATRVHDRAENAFRRMRDTLASRGFGYDQVIRTWLYLGDIVGPEADTQRYKELNRARAEFYEDLRFLRRHLPPALDGLVYPASTGIGASDREVMMSCVALATDREDVVAAPLENPLQTSAFRYDALYSPESPKFSRAMAVASPQAVAILVSGTASIVQSETRCVDDVEGQTRQTLDNIQALIARDNLARSGVPGAGATLDDLVLARVYIKHAADYARVRAICERRLGELPIIFAVADVCRPDLLVEIEGVVVAPRS